ncbi:clathrin heavy chain linker domain-containing protein 1 isoform X7 [Gopherus flavomarginatus]|uniref:clathrin heavy chain linker domain-containing protein 1 isoform X7 n=1 Tax=Gopherus flavomarginatus TaxID=286002 RepID=UPI0021CBE7B6|nr:clathrin heavy chain linker domain-containing protein 1 isoform X7 [Gopherus flavomarginatus]
MFCFSCTSIVLPFEVYTDAPWVTQTQLTQICTYRKSSVCLFIVCNCWVYVPNLHKIRFTQGVPEWNACISQGASVFCSIVSIYSDCCAVWRFAGSLERCSINHISISHFRWKNMSSQIIEHVTVYKNILTSIKQEYDAFIEAIKKGQRNAFYLHGKLKVLASEATTLIYYRKRAIQLEDKIKVIERNSSRIQNLILKIRNIKKVPSTEALAPRKKINPAKPIPGLTVKESLSLDALSRHLAQLEERVQELKADMISKYIPLENKAGLEQELKHSLELRDKAEAMNEKLRLSYNRITLVANAVSAWAKSDKSTSLQDLLSQVMEKKEVVKAAAAFSISHIFEHDPSKSKEAEDLLEYIERFNELFSYGQYEAAAVYAANCPRGILRNEETMMKFKDDYLFLLKNCPSIELIHCLTQEWNEKPALLSIGATILSLIDTDHKEHGLQLLEEINMGEENALEQVILNDTVCTLEGWKKIADTCAENKHEKLSQEILSILTSQEGVVQISPLDDDDDVKIMEHIFL